MVRMDRGRRRPAVALTVLGPVLGLVVGLAATGCSGDPEPRSASRPVPATAADTATGDPAAAPDRPISSQLPDLREPRRPVGPGQAARQLVAAHAVIDRARRTTPALTRAARQQQLTYREAATRPGWDRRLMAGLPPRLRDSARRNLAARREFRSMHHSLSDTLPAWRIVEPEPAERLLRHYRAAERRYGVGWEYLAAINLVETGMGRIRGTSVAGAQGPMQFIPATWARWGRGDVDDPADAIMAAARYLAASGFTRGPRGVAGALYAYNNHSAYVRGVTHYARDMEADPAHFYAYHQWEVVYLTDRGDVVLPVGYQRTRPVPVRRYLAAHPRG